MTFVSFVLLRCYGGAIGIIFEKNISRLDNRWFFVLKKS